MMADTATYPPVIMLILELFASGGDMMKRLRQDALSVITPYLGMDVPFVTVNQVIDGLKSNNQLGIVIDRSLIMDLLDPEQVKAIDRIEGNRIYLMHPDEDNREVDAEDAEKDQDRVTDMAQNQAQKQIQQ
jgi:hypothetical protein